MAKRDDVIPLGVSHSHHTHRATPSFQAFSLERELFRLTVLGITSGCHSTAFVVSMISIVFTARSVLTNFKSSKISSQMLQSHRKDFQDRPIEAFAKSIVGRLH